MAADTPQWLPSAASCDSALCSSRLSGWVPTEQINPATLEIDLASTDTVLRLINTEDQQVPRAIEQAIGQISPVVERVAHVLRQGGRLFYVGAGTSGRLGVLDAAECPPTFGTAPEQVQALMAGGVAALTQAIEGAEDDADAGQRDVLNAGITPNDVVVGISASGGAPYVVAAVTQARVMGAYTAGLTCCADSALAEAVVQPMVVAVGPEAIAGSTRMKAGTAQKLVLNMISTGAMILLGKTYQNLMVDVQPTNAKLRARAQRMVSALAGVSSQQAQAALEQTQYQVKPAVVMLVLGVTAQQSHQRLAQAGGKLRQALALEET